MPQPPPNAETFWKTLALSEMSAEQWESLCDGCGRCCLNKLMYEDTGEIAWTDLACKLLDGESCRCTDYPNRHRRVPDCQALNAENVPGLAWLPPTCGYRLVAEGRDLYWWHHLVSGDPETVHAAGISVRGKTQNEGDVVVEDYEDYVVSWPGEIPLSAKSPAAARRAR
jgi:uncharacterized cysteine cluster protein YcgN (CxxCxxCC family)